MLHWCWVGFVTSDSSQTFWWWALNTDFADDSDAEMFLAHESCMSLVSLTTVDKGCDIIFCAFILFFQGRFLLPHSCGAIAPQL